MYSICVNIILDYYYSRKHYSAKLKEEIHAGICTKPIMRTELRDNQLYTSLVKGYVPFKNLINISITNNFITIFDGKYYLDILFSGSFEHHDTLCFRANYDVRYICQFLIDNNIIKRRELSRFHFITSNFKFVEYIFNLLKCDHSDAPLPEEIFTYCSWSDSYWIDVSLSSAYKYIDRTFCVLGLLKCVN